MLRVNRASAAWSSLVFVTVVGMVKSDEPKATIAPAQKVPESATETPAKVPNQLFKGRVVRVNDSLKRRGIKAYSEELKDQVALESDVALQAMRLSDLMNTLATLPSKMRIVILDACRNNPFSLTRNDGKRSVSVGLARKCLMAAR